MTAIFREPAWTHIVMTRRGERLRAHYDRTRPGHGKWLLDKPATSPTGRTMWAEYASTAGLINVHDIDKEHRA